MRDYSTLEAFLHLMLWLNLYPYLYLMCDPNGPFAYKSIQCGSLKIFLAQSVKHDQEKILYLTYIIHEFLSTQLVRRDI